MKLTSAHDNASCPAVPPQILLVDDEQDILPEYQEFFEFAGFHAHICADPLTAFDLILNNIDIRIVITDMRMAQIDGASMIRDLRAVLPADRRIDFFILTGDASIGSINYIPDVPVFLKPADTDALLAAVHAAIERP